DAGVARGWLHHFPAGVDEPRGLPVPESDSVSLVIGQRFELRDALPRRPARRCDGGRGLSERQPLAVPFVGAHDLLAGPARVEIAIDAIRDGWLSRGGREAAPERLVGHELF